MLEIRFHGRGGQGAVTAANILAVAAFKEGQHCQSFPIFGGERRGAPVLAFTRSDDRKVSLRCKVYEPDHVIVLDPALMQVVDVTAGLKDGAWIIINTEQAPEEIHLPVKFNIATVDAASIAVKHGLGSPQAPIVNTAILGAFSRVVGAVGLKAVLEAVREESPVRKEENAAAAEEAYEHVRVAKGENR